MTNKTEDLTDACHADSSRLEAFSDGVFAIIITLLVIEIHRPDAAPGKLGEALIHSWPFYAAYVLAFLYVGVLWLNHHALFQRIERVDHPLLWINMGILGTSALMPFPTGVLAVAFQSGNVNDQQSAVVLYSIVAGLMSAAWLPIFPYLHKNRHLAHGHASDTEFRAQYSRPIVGIAAYLLAGGLGWFVSPWLAIVIFAGMVVYHGWTSQGLRR
jgi:uncharacterized membrane protein